jgi:arylsulfatase A-like enzyme
MILADDLGVGETGCYGQQVIRTPNIDHLAADGMRFTNAYAPAPMCSPTRCSLLTGLHQGHAYVRNNKELEPEGQMPLAAGTVTVAELLKRGGYATACIGKWGLGPVGSEGDPLKMGFDYFYGHNCQRVAHNHYTDHIWRNDDRVALDGNAVDRVRGKQYVPDMMADEAVKWLKEHKQGPFFLYFAPPLPHASLQAPDEAVAQYRPLVKEGEKYPGKPGEYLPCDEPRATYAAMITRLDRHVGQIVAALKDLGLDDNTIVVFSSDNGPQVFGGPDAAYFHSTGGLRGLKHDLYEGGIREPLIVRWPGHVKGGTTSSYQTVLYDMMPTFLDLAGLPKAERTDGVSLVPLLSGSGQQQAHPFLYWEHAGVGGQKAVRQGKWKAIWVGLKKDPTKAGELYDLEKDPDETTDVSKGHPDVMRELTRLRDESHEPSVVKAWNY